MGRVRTLTTGLLAGGAALALAACGSPAATSDSPSGVESGAGTATITVGFTAGPYEDQFTDAIAPQLEAKGYTVEKQSFTDYIQTDAALDEGSIQANVIQHPVFLDYVNSQRGFDNVALVQVPTPPMGLFAGTSEARTPARGATVAVPSDPSNLYRALLLLEKIGWVSVSDTIDSGTASLNDVTANPHELTLTLMDSSQGVRALKDVDYGLIQGNFAVSAGIPLTDALELETLEDRFTVVLAVKGGTEDTAWAKDIVEAYHSKKFQDYITTDPRYAGYDHPDYFTEG